MRRPPAWVPLIPLAAAAAMLGVGVSEGAHRASDTAAPPWVEPAAVVLDAFPAWADPRWQVELEELLASFPGFRADDREALDALAAELGALSFVSAADAPSVDGAGGLRLGLRLRRPVAAVPVGSGYLTVDDEGVILSGGWSSPPKCEDLWLPVILPGTDARGAPLDFDLARPGDWLDAPEHLAALDTALSLARSLAPEDLARLGRVAIDGSGQRVRGPEDQGVLILLENERLIVFGRPPGSGQPGELPPERKWRAVSAALAELERDGDAPFWDLADVRWDVPELRYRGEAGARVAAALGAQPTLGAEPTIGAPPAPAAQGWPAAWSTAGSAPAGAAHESPAAAPRDSAAAGRPRVR
jgi:hypothetical protein